MEEKSSEMIRKSLIPRTKQRALRVNTKPIHKKGIDILDCIKIKTFAQQETY